MGHSLNVFQGETGLPGIPGQPGEKITATVGAPGRRVSFANTMRMRHGVSVVRPTTLKLISSSAIIPDCTCMLNCCVDKTAQGFSGAYEENPLKPTPQNAITV